MSWASGCGETGRRLGHKMPFPKGVSVRFRPPASPSSLQRCGCSTQTTSTINLKRSTLHPHEGQADRPNTPSDTVNPGSNLGPPATIPSDIASYFWFWRHVLSAPPRLRRGSDRGPSRRALRGRRPGPTCTHTDFSDGIARRDNFFSYNSKMAAMPHLNDGDYRPDLLFVASSGDWPGAGLR
jgi:hypothetical protein